MSAGQPDWMKLMKAGKLPKEQRGKIPLLAQLDTAEAVIDEISKGCCGDCRAKFFPGTEASKNAEVVTMKCEVEGCDFVAQGKLKMNAANALRKHTAEQHPTAPKLGGNEGNK